MKQTNRSYLIAPLLLVPIFFLSSCRKKDEKYEGYYVGVERYTYLDSGATEYSIDTTYNQEVDIIYGKLETSRRKYYSILKIYNNPNNQSFTLHRKDFENHIHTPIYGGGYVKFSGDSLYLYQTNFSDTEENWNSETVEFRGKRN